MIQASELFNLLMGCIGMVLYHTNLQRVRFAGDDLFRLAFYAMLGSFICTVLEGFFWPSGLNLLEHIGYALSAILFAGGCHRLASANSRSVPGAQGAE